MGGRGSSSTTAMSKATASNAAKLQMEHTAWQNAKDIMDELGCTMGEAFDYYDAISSFTGSGYSSIRRDQRDGITNDKADNLEKFIAIAPQWAGGPTYRGLKFSDAAKFKEMTTVGAIVDINAGTASWSTDISISDNFAHNNSGHSVVFIHDAPRQRGTSIKNLSNYNSESEVLVSKDVRYKVVSVSQGYGPNNDRTYVHIIDA